MSDEVFSWTEGTISRERAEEVVGDGIRPDGCIYLDGKDAVLTESGDPVQHDRIEGDLPSLNFFVRPDSDDCREVDLIRDAIERGSVTAKQAENLARELERYAEEKYMEEAK